MVHGVSSGSGIVPTSSSSSSSSSTSPGNAQLGVLGNPRIVPARTPVGIDAPLERSSAAIQRDLARSLKDMVSGHLIGKSASGKAAEIASKLPQEVVTEEGLQNLRDAIGANPDEVRSLLHFGDGECGNAQGRATARAVVTSLIMDGDLSAARSMKRNLPTMSAADRDAALQRSLPVWHMEDALSVTDSSESDRTGPVSRTERALNARLDWKPNDTVLFGGRLVPGETLRPGHTGSPTDPHGIRVGIEEARTLTGMACRTDHGEVPTSRFAWIGYPATGSQFLMTDSLAPCTPVVVFWKGADGVQQATLFHFSALITENDVPSYMEKIAPDARIDSITYVERRLGDPDSRPRLREKERLCSENLESTAREMGVPYNLLSHGRDEGMAILVDVRSATIVSTDTAFLTGYSHPLGRNRAEDVEKTNVKSY